MSGVTLYAAAIDDPCDPDLYEAALARESRLRRDLAARFRLADDARRLILGGALVAWAAADRCGVLPGSPGGAYGFRYSYGPSGKPEVSGLPGFRFNVSHSGRWVIVGVADGDIGIDVETVDADRPMPELVELARHVFTPDEQRLLASGDPRVFYRLWTLKESYVKYLGLGLSAPLDAFTFAPGPAGWTLHVAESAAALGGSPVVPRFFTPELDPDHLVAVSVAADDVGAIRRFDAADILYDVTSRL